MSARTGSGSVHELPEDLPENEHVLWQGAPSFIPLARALHIVPLAGYFAVLLAWYGIDNALHHTATAAGCARMAALAAAAIALFAAYAFLVSRTTSYTLTTRRMVIQAGIALPISINIPFAALRAADLRARADGVGDLVLDLMPGTRIGYLALFPHARPWRLGRVQPMLRAVPHIARVGRMLTTQVAAGGAALALGQGRAPGRATNVIVADPALGEYRPAAIGTLYAAD